MFPRIKTLPPMLVVVPVIFIFGALATTVAVAAEPLVPLAVNCDDSVLEPHTGFQVAPACSNTAFGEISDAALNPSLLIVGAPKKVQKGEGFAIDVSTRNLVRDRFLAAGQGGYYLESALLNDAGLTRGHFHLACRSLATQAAAPGNPEAVPEFFKAVEDGGGSAVADTVRVEVPGKNAAGANLFARKTDIQCTAWAGDGSHRTPMMERANQTPAIDSVRIEVQG